MRTRRSLIIIYAILSLIVCSVNAQIDFISHAITQDEVVPGFIDVCDLDNDGDYDILAAEYNWSVPQALKIYWFENSGNYPPLFNQQLLVDEEGIFMSGYTIIDFDFDGDVDIIMNHRNCIYVLYNDGLQPPSFDYDVIYENEEIVMNFRAIKAADFDEDGDLDIVTGANWDWNWQQYHDTGIVLIENFDNEEFIGYVNHVYNFGVIISDLAVGDIDLDNDLDLVFTISNGLRAMLNDGNLNFTEFEISDIETGSVEIADMDSDGDMDFVAATYVFNNNEVNGEDDYLFWLENDGQQIPEFTFEMISLDEYCVEDLILADLDLDLNLDIIECNGAHMCDPDPIERIRYRLNGAFPNPSFYTLVNNCDFYSKEFNVKVVDIDGDGDKDIINRYGPDDELAWFENLTISDERIFPFQLTTPGDGFVSPDTQIVLSWNSTVANFETEINYGISIHEDPISFGIIDETTDTSFSFTGQPGVRYYWNIVAFSELDNCIHWAEDEPWNFYIEDYSSVGEILQFDLPTGISIAAIHPNPFNSSTNITVALPQHTLLKVNVYNISGQQIATLANGEFDAGYQSFTLDGSHLASGIYFVRAYVPRAFNQVKKIVLIN